jgi:Tfp pilus assembly protein PilF
MLRKIPWPWLALWATLGLFGVASYVPWYGMWGINHLAFLTNGWWLVFWITVAVVLFLTIMRDPTPRLDGTLSAISDLIFERGVWPRLAVVAGFGIVFWGLRVPTHFLGDGYTLLSGLGRGEVYIVKWTEPGSVWLIRFLQRLSGQYTKDTALFSFQILSIISGAIVVHNLILICRRIMQSASIRVLGLTVLLFSGVVLLWCGYVEFYPTLWAFASTFLLLLIRYTQTGRGLPIVVGLFLATCLVHLQAVCYLPGLAYAIVHKEWEIRRGKSLGRTWLFAGLVVVCFSTFGFFWLYSTSIEFETMFLPFFNGRPHSPEYAVLSPKHLIDSLNQVLLMFPAFTAVIAVLIPSGRRKPNGRGGLLGTLRLCAAGSLAFLLLVDPVIGLARDWDLMSLTLFLPILLTLALLNQVNALSTRLIISILVLSLGLTGTFVAANVGKASSENRFHELLRYYGTKNRSGWVIFSTYYAEQRNTGAVSNVRKEMSQLFPEDRRLNDAYSLVARGNADSALTLARQLVRLDPYRGDYYQILGNAHGKLGHLDSADANYRIAMRLTPYSPMLKNEYGQLLIKEQRYGDARTFFKRIRDYDRSIMQVAEGLALTYYYLRNDDSALALADTLFSADPHSAGGHLIYMIVSLRQGDTATARQHYEQYLIFGKSRSDYEGIREHYQYLTK